jgi:putative colanic acid biosynthesis UDP-glucose lipid carrier transferase
MIVQRTRGLRRLLAFTQAGLATILYWVVFATYNKTVSPGTLIFTRHYVIYWAIVLAGLMLEMLSRESDELIAPIYDSSLVRQLPLASRQVAYALGGLLVFLAFAKDYAISRAILANFAALLYVMLVWSNAVLPLRFARWLFGADRNLATLLVGPVHRVAPLEFWLQRKREFGLSIIGLATLDVAAPAAAAAKCPVPVLGTVAQFDEICARQVIAQVILLEVGDTKAARSLLDRCQQRGIRLLIVNDLAEQLHHPITCSVDEGVNLITLHEEPLENPLNRVLKRSFDVVFASLVTVMILPPLIVFIWICHRLQSPGPLWHRQRRAGLQNRPFEILKFRTMKPAAENVTQQATADDARVFPAGRWLRRFSLDEIPQFLNVLRGEMSVVGPRPHLVEHNQQFAEVIAEYHIRTFIKPGITGLAQVRGFRGEARTPEDIAARLQSDLIYLENWSFALDLGIILRTIWQMLKPPSTAV